MKFPLPADTFPTLQLSPDERRALEAAAETIVKTAIEQYYDHLTKHKGVVDETRWKKLKQREDVQLYRERKKASGEASSSSFGVQESASRSSNSSSDAGGSLGSTSTSSDHLAPMTAMLNFGSIQGTLDDVMYGILSPSAEEMQLKTMYIESGMEDWRLLASIIKPSEADPFRELSIKWSVKGHPPPLSAVVRARDGVVIESVGIAMTPNGERIGYHLYHSVDVPGVRELAELKIVRSQISICEFFRQRNEHCVEIYARSVLNPMGDVPPMIMTLSASKVAISVFKYVHCANMKKLTRLLRSSQPKPQTQSDRSTVTSSRSGSSATLPPSSTSSSSSGTCELCSQSLDGRLHLSLGRSTVKQCQICSARVCSHCRVEKTIYLPTEVAKQLRSESMNFCTRCMVSASSASSFKFAVLDAMETEGKSVDYRDALH